MGFIADNGIHNTSEEANHSPREISGHFGINNGYLVVLFFWSFFFFFLIVKNERKEKKNKIKKENCHKESLERRKCIDCWESGNELRHCSK